MVKKSSKRVSKTIVAEPLSYDDHHNVSWPKIGITLIVGCLLGLYFGNSTLSIQAIMLFIAIILIVLCLALLLDIRRNVCKL